MKTYTKIAELGNLILINDYSVILDATFTNPEYKKLVDSILISKATFISCSAPKEVLIDRLNKRKNDVADADVSIMEKQLQRWTEIEDAILIDTSKKVDYKNLV